MARLLLGSMFFLGTLLLVGCTVPPSSGVHENVDSNVQNPTACFETRCWQLEIADDGPSQQRGLMGREFLDPDAGMLFVFQQIGSRQFWMKDTLLPLDMIWLDDRGTVVHIASDVPPCPPEEEVCPTYGPDEKVARYVLEVNAGQVAETSLDVGSQIRLSY